MRMLFGAVGLAVLAGCSTTAVSVDEASPAPANRITGYQKPLADGGKIIVVRDSGFNGGGCYATVFLNGKAVAQLNPREKVEFYVAPGDWVLGAALDGGGLCALNPNRLETDLTIKSGQVKKYRVYKPGDGDVGVKPTTI